MRREIWKFGCGETTYKPIERAKLMKPSSVRTSGELRPETMTLRGSPPFPAPAMEDIGIERACKRTRKSHTVVQHRATVLSGVDVCNSIPLRRGRKNSTGLKSEGGEGEGQHGGRTRDGREGRPLRDEVLI